MAARKYDGRSNPRPLKDFVGRPFSGWFVMARDGAHEPGKVSRWLCKCACGTQRSVSQDSLVSERSKNCGCGAAEIPPETLQKYWDELLAIGELDGLANVFCVGEIKFDDRFCKIQRRPTRTGNSSRHRDSSKSSRPYSFAPTPPE
jgi:hypothetical protein